MEKIVITFDNALQSSLYIYYFTNNNNMARYLIQLFQNTDFYVNFLRKFGHLYETIDAQLQISEEVASYSMNGGFAVSQKLYLIAFV